MCSCLDERLDLSLGHAASLWVVSSKNSVYIAKGKALLHQSHPLLGIKRNNLFRQRDLRGEIEKWY